MNKALLISALIISIIQCCIAQDIGPFSGERFPAHVIDTSIINERGLQEEIRMLKEECNWENRIGEKIDVFWIQTENGNLFGHVYEYFLDCDNLRLIYWYQGPELWSQIIDFMIEPLEEESLFVVRKRKHLKNRKKYKEYFYK